MMDDLSNYAYLLPKELIADKPLDVRDDSRLLVVERLTGELHHHRMRNLPTLLEPADCLVLNDTKVIPARLFGRRAATGGKWEGLYLGSCEPGAWRLIGHSRGKLKVGEKITLVPAHDPAGGDELELTLLEHQPDGVWIAEPATREDVFSVLDRYGTVPLPPYLGRKLATDSDWQRYQTTYARHPGAVAAPTAGLHFTPELLQECRQKGISLAYVTLHVGIGTFRPIAVEKLSEHRMHSEWCELGAQTAELLNRTKTAGGRIVAVGTTTVRTLESAAQSAPLSLWRGETNLFIRPPYQFRAVECLLTNFHLPKSTLLVLVSAFAGIDLIKKAYRCAIEQKYRFYSYGDAMLII